MGAGVFIWAVDQTTGIPRPLECNDQGALKVDLGVLPVWELIETKTLAIDRARISFAGISTDYNFLRLTIFSKTTDVADESLRIIFNDDVGANYNYESLRVVGAVVSGSTTAAANSGHLGMQSHDYFSVITVYIQNKAAGDHKIASSHSSGDEAELGLSSIRWANATSKIIEVDLFFTVGDLAAGSKFILEGTKE